MSGAPFLRARGPGLAGLPHGFLTREGGVSEGPWGSLNCGPGSGDDPERVRTNRARALAAVGAAGMRLATPSQRHGAVAAIADGAGGPAPEADAVVASRPGTAVGVLTADCAPVLLADARAGVVGAAHAGWRGALAGIVGAAVDAMCGLGARRERISAAVGPAIGRESYEVDPPFRGPFVAERPAADALFRPAGGKLLFDLPAFVVGELERAGVGGIEHLDHDTVRDRRRFFSHRRNRNEGEGRYGRMLSLIAVP